MNIELKPIAESKVRQLGGDVCGVLVRKDGRLAAVDEHGRVQWLQSGQGAEPMAWYLPGEGGCDSQFRDHATVNSCTGNPWAGWQPLYTHPQPAQQGSVPEGWKLVPIEPDEYMLNAGMRAFCGGGRVFQAMVEAAPQPEGDGWIKCSKQDLAAILGNLQYAGFNLCREFDFSRIQRPGRRTTESTCPDDSLLIAIRDLSELIDEPLPQPPAGQEGNE